MDVTAVGAGSGARAPRLAWWLVALGVVYLYAFPYFGALRHANELPRVLTTEQLVEHHTFRLDERLADLGSLADISTTPDGHRYQNKAPGMSVLGVPVYAALKLAYAPFGQRPPRIVTTWALRVGLGVLPTLVFFAWFPRVAARFAVSAEARHAGLVAGALGSMLWPLSLLFMSHALAAALVGVAFVLASDRERCSELTIGALLGCAMFVEYQALFGAAIVGLYVVGRSRRPVRTALALASAAAPFLALLALYHWSAFGSPLRTGYAYSVDEANRTGVMGIVGFSGASAAQLFVTPDNGLLVLTPWFLLLPVGLVYVLADAERRARAGREAVVAASVVTAYCLFVAVLVPEFGRGGWEVGPRYIAVALPFAAWLACAGFEACFSSDALRVPALALLWTGVIVHALAATTYPHWPVELRHPLYEVSVRLLTSGHAPHSIGQWLGLSGWGGLVPVYLLVCALVWTLLAGTRRYRLEVVLAAILAVAVVAAYSRFPRTGNPDRDRMWQFVTSTYEP